MERRLRTRDHTIRLDSLLELDQERRRLIQEVEALKYRRNVGSEEIGRLKSAGDEAEAQARIKEMGELARQIDNLDERLKQIEGEIHDLLARLPNLPHPSVPVSEQIEDKQVLKTYQESPTFDFPFKNHIELGESLGLLDFPRAAKIAGARFPMYRGLGAKLEMALIYFMFHYQVEENGYEPIFPPFLGNQESFFAASLLPKFQDDVYYIEKDDLYLNPTAEAILANLHRDEILSAEQLPLNYAGFTTCFRREAGSYGEEERGLIRIHQFNKVELFKFTEPECSYDELEHLIEDAEDILKALDLHYRVALLTTSDMAMQSAKTIDLEVWLPSQGRYYEVSSCSNCEDFQARRGNIRYRPEPKAKPRYVHMLNGSGLATSRLLAAILENNQQEDGSVIVPKVLQKDVGVDVIRGVN
ncbi:MAG: serine--tRNA ligase [Candidatus Bipolaricaulia bacterium]